MNKIINPCKCKVYTRNGAEVYRNAFVKIKYNNSKLSIRGVIAPLSSGNALGSCGQCTEEIRKGIPTDKWNKEMLSKFCDIWDEWHLNYIRPYCSHMKELGWTKYTQDKVKVEKWTLTKEASQKKNRALECLRNGEPFYPTEDETIYANMKRSIDVYNDEIALYGPLCKDVYELKEKDCLGHSNTEYKTRGWISYKDHELGFIGRPCPVCGYKYGTAWKTEEVPAEVIEWLENLPETDVEPAWV